MSDTTTNGGGLRKRRSGYFVQIPRETIRDRSLSWKARGLLAFLLDMPEGWDVRSPWLAEQGKEGKDAVQSGLRELRRAGYYRLERRRLLDGTITMGTAISETPVPEWAKQSAEYGDGPVPVFQQPDGSFRVKLKDGTFTADGFEDAEPAEKAPDQGEPLTLTDNAGQGDRPPVLTGAGFSGTGESRTGDTGAGFSGAGSSGTGKPRTIKRSETGEPRRTTPPSPSASASTAGRDRSVTADAATDGALAFDLFPQANDGGFVMGDDTPSESEQAPTLSVVTGDDTPEPDFDQFWQVYPRKTGKVAAEKAWRKAVKQVGARKVYEGAVRFANDPNLPGPSEARFIPHPTTWLNQGRWDDPPLPPRGNGPQGGRGVAYRDELVWGTAEERAAEHEARKAMTPEEIEALVDAQMRSGRKKPKTNALEDLMRQTGQSKTRGW